MEEQKQRRPRRKSRSCILTSLDDGSAHPFLSFGDADEFLGKKHGYTRLCVRNGTRISRRDEETGHLEYFEIEVGPQNNYKVELDRSPEQLCWTCKRACGGCPWSRYFTPIKGWTAVSVYKDRNWTYCITACPLYDPDKRRKNNEKITSSNYDSYGSLDMCCM